MALTQLNPIALPGARYGSFAGKAADAGHGPHNPGTITQMHPTALPGGRYGSFAGKALGAAASTDWLIRFGRRAKNRGKG